MTTLILFGFALYWLPTIIAVVRKTPSALGIAAFNFFLGWTVIGWIVALIWSLAATPTPQVVVYVDSATGRTSQQPNFR